MDRSPTRLILWLAIAVAAPVMYVVVALALDAGGYEAASSWTVALPVFAAVGVAELGAILLLRARVRPGSAPDGPYITTLALCDAIAVQGLFAYLAFGSAPTMAVMMAGAAVGALLTRPSG